jgi:hypothetical protein
MLNVKTLFNNACLWVSPMNGTFLLDAVGEATPGSRPNVTKNGNVSKAITFKSSEAIVFKKLARKRDVRLWTFNAIVSNLSNGFL